MQSSEPVGFGNPRQRTWEMLKFRSSFCSWIRRGPAIAYRLISPAVACISTDKQEMVLWPMVDSDQHLITSSTTSSWGPS